MPAVSVKDHAGHYDTPLGDATRSSGTIRMGGIVGGQGQIQRADKGEAFPTLGHSCEVRTSCIL